MNQILACLAADRGNAQRFFKYLVHEDIGKNGERIVDILNDEPEGSRMEALLRTVLDVKQSVSPVQRKQRILSRPELDELFTGIDIYEQVQRNTVIVAAFRLYGYTQLEIGNYLGLNRSTVSKIVSKTY